MLSARYNKGYFGPLSSVGFQSRDWVSCRVLRAGVITSNNIQRFPQKTRSNAYRRLAVGEDDRDQRQEREFILKGHSLSNRQALAFLLFLPYGEGTERDRDIAASLLHDEVANKSGAARIAASPTATAAFARYFRISHSETTYFNALRGSEELLHRFTTFSVLEHYEDSGNSDFASFVKEEQKFVKHCVGRAMDIFDTTTNNTISATSRIMLECMASVKDPADSGVLSNT